MSDCFDLTIIDQLRADLARVTAELKQLRHDKEFEVTAATEKFCAAHNENASLHSRVAELEADNQELENRITGYINYEGKLERDIAALFASNKRLTADIGDITEVWGHEITDYLKARAEGRAESATPAKQSPSIDAESLIAACIPGGSICDPQQVADAIREYLRPQEPCGGRCGDPDCDLDTTGVAMRTPAPHADTVRLNQRSIQLHVYTPLTGEWEPTIFEDVDLRAAIDAAKEARK